MRPKSFPCNGGASDIPSAVTPHSVGSQPPRAGLRHTKLRLHTVSHRFRNTQHMVFASLHERLFLAADVILLPGKDPGIMQVVQEFAPNTSISQF